MVNYDPLISKTVEVWYCANCDDQPPWRAEQLYNCPNCKKDSLVIKAERFQNLTTETDGTARHV